MSCTSAGRELELATIWPLGRLRWSFALCSTGSSVSLLATVGSRDTGRECAEVGLRPHGRRRVAARGKSWPSGPYKQTLNDAPKRPVMALAVEEAAPLPGHQRQVGYGWGIRDQAPGLGR